ncbi:MAG: Zn-ribbon domain-containing OB-fold protein [Gulosibacter sp.]|uniref:Zn-ribbon domain-containing OB-fold protein n=1 Tax=Gulosibacter sp. TaxID=2817531 RepID=UPI003F8EA3BE
MTTTTGVKVSTPLADLDDEQLIGDFAAGKRLVGTTCQDCEQHMIGARGFCSNCMSDNVRRIALPTNGTLYSFTRLHVGLEGTRPIGYVDLDGVGVRTLADLRETGQPLTPDIRVELVTEGDDWFFAPQRSN